VVQPYEAVGGSAYGTAMDMSVGRTAVLRLTVIRGGVTHVRNRPNMDASIEAGRKSSVESSNACLTDPAT